MKWEDVAVLDSMLFLLRASARTKLFMSPPWHLSGA